MLIYFNCRIMDHYPFEINFYISGCDIDKFLMTLKNAGFDNQANVASIQIKEQLKEL